MYLNIQKQFQNSRLILRTLVCAVWTKPNDEKKGRRVRKSHRRRIFFFLLKSSENRLKVGEFFSLLAPDLDCWIARKLAPRTPASLETWAWSRVGTFTSSQWKTSISVQSRPSRPLFGGRNYIFPPVK